MIDKLKLQNDLTQCLKNLKELGDYDLVIDLLTEQLKIRSLIGMYNHTELFDDNDKIIVSLIINILQEVYNNATIESPVPDEEYDILYEINRVINGEEIVGASVGTGNKPVGYHTYTDLRGTLDKIHFITNDQKINKNEVRRSLEDWLKSCENRIGRKLIGKELDVYLFPKWDGISAIIEVDENRNVEQVLSRGDTDKNEAVVFTGMFNGTDTTFSFIPEFRGHRIGIKTEIVMSQKNYDQLCADVGMFKSSRSAVSSIFNEKNLDQSYLKYLTIIPLQIQNYDTKEIAIPKSTITDYPFAKSSLNDMEDIKDKIDYIKNSVERLHGIDIDGVVIRIVDRSIQSELGRLDKINKYEVAYKFPAPFKKTIIRDVEFSVGVFGSITPVAIVDPIKLLGNTINSPSLGSIDIFESLNLHEGDEVIIKYNIVPYLTVDETCAKGTGKKFVTPTNCVYCGFELVYQPQLQCVNLDCSCRVIGKIVNYVEKMRIPDISVGTITTLFNHGLLTSIESLYDLEDKIREISILPGFGAKSAQKIINGINSVKSVYDYELLGSIGIMGVGRRKFKEISNIYNISELQSICMNNDLEKLTSIGGVQDKTAQKIIYGLLTRASLIEFLCSRLEIKREENNKQYKGKVYFTGIRDSEFSKYLETIDIKSTDSFTKDVDFLIIPNSDMTGNKKVEKATKQGKTILTITEAYKLFNYET